MKALSIRQPWAWHILNSGKDIENRDWPTHFRGRVLIHVSKGCTKAEYEKGNRLDWLAAKRGFELPPLDKMTRGGIVGSVDIVDCVSHSDSPWFFGKFGFVLRNPQPLPFIPYRGQLGFFEVPDTLAAVMVPGFGDRIAAANQLIKLISRAGRRFFYSPQSNQTAAFVTNVHNELLLIDDFTGAAVRVLASGDESWNKFSHGGTLRRLVECMAHYILGGQPLSINQIAPVRDDGSNYWGYDKATAQALRLAAAQLPIIAA